MENQVNQSKTSALVTTILVIIIIGLGAFIVYDKYINDSGSKNENLTTTQSQSALASNCPKCEECQKCTTTDNVNAITTRKCTGTYKGEMIVEIGVNPVRGNVTLTLKDDGTYLLEREGVNGDFGYYSVVENALLLRKSPDICPPNTDCTKKTITETMKISDDCSTITSFDALPASQFTLTRQ